MYKYRITSIINSDNWKDVSYHIQRKKWYGWRNIVIKENENSSRLTFKSFDEAMFYCIKHYCKFGEIFQPYPNVIEYRPYSFNM